MEGSIEVIDNINSMYSRLYNYSTVSLNQKTCNKHYKIAQVQVTPINTGNLLNSTSGVGKEQILVKRSRRLEQGNLSLPNQIQFGQETEINRQRDIDRYLEMEK